MGLEPASWVTLAAMAASQVSAKMKADKEAKQAEEAKKKQAGAAQYAADARVAGVERQTRLERQAEEADFRRQMSGARVGLAKGGMSTGAGSALEALGSATAQHNKNLMMINEQGRREASAARNAGIYGSPMLTAQSTSDSQNGFDVANSLLSLGARAFQLYNAS